MAFTRVNPSGWAIGAKLTSAQQNQLDIDHANALDKSAAGDTLLGVVVLGPGAQLVAANAANIVASGENAIESSSYLGINATVAGAIIASAAGAIQPTVAGGINDGGLAG